MTEKKFVIIVRRSWKGDIMNVYHRRAKFNSTWIRKNEAIKICRISFESFKMIIELDGFVRVCMPWNVEQTRVVVVVVHSGFCSFFSLVVNFFFATYIHFTLLELQPIYTAHIHSVLHKHIQCFADSHRHPENRLGELTTKLKYVVTNWIWPVLWVYGARKCSTFVWDEGILWRNVYMQMQLTKGESK